MAGARFVVAVDPVEWKREQATSTFGATHSAASIEEAMALVSEITWGAKADKAILTTGVADRRPDRPDDGHGVQGRAACVVTAVAPISQEDVKLNLFDLAMQRKELVGCIFGNANPRRDIPRLLRLYKDGQLKLDELVTTTYDARRRQPGLPGHARRQEHPGRHQLLISGCRLTGTRGPPARAVPSAR